MLNIETLKVVISHYDYNVVIHTPCQYHHYHNSSMLQNKKKNKEEKLNNDLVLPAEDRKQCSILLQQSNS